MHQSALEKMKEFFDVYLSDFDSASIKILDVGSMIAHEEQTCHRSIIDQGNWQYTGMDIDVGPNVDVVVKNPYQWAEFRDSSFDVVICSQVFEHAKYFWITALEIARVLKSGGLCCIIAPSSGNVHRFPFDCWRFYPDGLPSVITYASLNILESYVHPANFAVSGGADTWRDACVIAYKPQFSDTQQQTLSIKHKLNSMLLRSSLDLDDLRKIEISVNQEEPSALNITQSRNAFTNLEAKQLRKIGKRMLKAKAAARHIREAIRVFKN